MNALHLALADYLHLRRSLGFKLVDAGLQLPRFVDFLIERDADHITVALALEWAQLSDTVQPNERARRLGYVRTFARYLSASDPRTEIPPRGCCRTEPRARSHICTAMKRCNACWRRR